MNAIVFNNVNLEFSTKQGRMKVLDQVSFEVEEGSFTCLLGPSGAGKSVTLNILAGILQATSGEILVKGHPRGSIPIRYGYVFQQPRLLPWRTVRENIRFVLKAIQIKDRKEQDRRIDSVLSLVGLMEYGRLYPQQLSGGMQQRVGIARAYAMEPDILLMDEPFSSLDEITARSLREELIQTWLRVQRTIVFVTHDIAEASYLADQILLYTPKPTRVAASLHPDIPRPRKYGSEELFRVEQQVMREFERSMLDSSPEDTFVPGGPPEPVLEKALKLADGKEL